MRDAAVITQECQRGAIGDRGIWAPLVEAAARTVVPNGARLLDAARAAGVPVIHGVKARRRDGAGANRNAPLFATTRRADALLLGTPDVEVLPELIDPGDLVLTRLHGVSPMSGTGLDALLRNLGVRTVVVLGVSVNVAITNLVFDAVNLGYQVVVARDAVAGVPDDYTAAVLEHTIGLVADVVTTDDLVATWTS